MATRRVDLRALEAFVVAAKRATYVGDGERAAPSRPGAHDLTFSAGAFRYRDSYFGGTDFLGQTVEAYALDYFGGLVKPWSPERAHPGGKYGTGPRGWQS
jgi:hypothetical protein